MDRDKALTIINKYVKNKHLIHHMLAVEAAMRFYANKYKQDEEKWGIAGLLHDFDWEIHPSVNDHPQLGARLLRDENIDEEIIRAILSHADHTGIKRISLLEKFLYACDEITGLITAVALVRPSKSILDVNVSSIKKKWKNKLFAANVNRDEIEASVDILGIDLWEHVENVLITMQKIANVIGLKGVP